MPDDLSAKGIGPEPAVSRWELWSLTTILRTTHGEDAEAHAAERLRDAEERGHEGDAIVWRGVLERLRA